MQKRLNTIILLDDNLATNFIHKKFIADVDCADRVLDFQSGKNALAYLGQKDTPQPELMFVDINMPIMSAWEFLERYQKIEGIDTKKTVIVLLSTSLSPADQQKVEKIPIIKDIRIKPLSEETILKVLKKFF